ncbi:hypothetical protein PR003_g31524 [Phytophthora rubi]|uniref:HNH nuclease domain-containing protein n=1 Tax=Phytophthora rubi TaxID=129364 RepID=A0A6A4BBC1_9STRA|nr:hypothetical protein PR003_g31524 [Phytophthora rubi]
MLIKVLSILPGHLWGSAIVFTPEEFTLEKNESKLCAIFGNKSKAQIKGLTNTVSVHHVVPRDSRLLSQEWWAHLKNKCEKRKRDIELKVFRRNIWSYPSALKKARNDREPTPKMTGKGKFKAQAKGKERTVVSTND